MWKKGLTAAFTGFLGLLSSAKPTHDVPNLTLSQLQTIERDGHERSFYYYKPKNFDPSLGMIMYLHGGGEDALEAAYNSTNELWLRLADRVGVLVLFPNGAPINKKGTERTWNTCQSPSKVFCVGCVHWDDIGFLKSLVPWVANHIHPKINTKRVYAAGVSYGGVMTERLALEANDVFTAVANVAGNLPVSNAHTRHKKYKCTGYRTPYQKGRNDREVPTFLFKGSLDFRIPYGTEGVDHKTYCQITDPKKHPPCLLGAFHSYYDTVAFWQWKLGISSNKTHRVDPTSTRHYADTVRRCTNPNDMKHCDGSIVVRRNYGKKPHRLVWELAVGGGHTFPGPWALPASTLKVYGWKNRDREGSSHPYVAERMWDFFRQFKIED